ncbi:MAG: hypothetical protein ACQEQE_09170 [Bacillota bacterium]
MGRKIKIYIKTEDVNITWLPSIPIGLIKMILPIFIKFNNKWNNQKQIKDKKDKSLNYLKNIDFDIKEIKLFLDVLKTCDPCTLVEVDSNDALVLIKLV